jgi:divalent metal cation (Fe/Co/Zn/Cd) transporter
MSTKRSIEIFSGRCRACEGTVTLVNQLACPSCDITVVDMKDPKAASRAKSLGIGSVPAVVINGTLADPLIAGAIGLFILPRTWGLMRQTLHVLMEGVPLQLDIREIETAMTAVHGVQAVHDLHVWTLTSGKDAMSSHVVVKNLAAGDRILRDLHRLLHERFGIEHTTMQLASEPLVQIMPVPDREET